MTEQFKVDVRYDEIALYGEGLKYAKAGDAGLDLIARYDVEIGPGETKKIHTGVYLHIHSGSAAGIVLPRSGLGGKEGLILGNSVGLIDSGYQGEVLCFMWNRNERETGKSITVSRGMRFAQLVFMPVLHPVLNVVEEFKTVTERGVTGFGSSGR